MVADSLVSKLYSLEMTTYRWMVDADTDQQMDFAALSSNLRLTVNRAILIAVRPYTTTTAMSTSSIPIRGASAGLARTLPPISILLNPPPSEQLERQQQQSAPAPSPSDPLPVVSQTESVVPASQPRGGGGRSRGARGGRGARGRGSRGGRRGRGGTVVALDAPAEEEEGPVDEAERSRRSRHAGWTDEDNLLLVSMAVQTGDQLLNGISRAA